MAIGAMLMSASTEDAVTDHPDLIAAREIIKEIAPKHHPELSCMLIAAAIAGLRGYKFSQIRVGALYHAEKFKDDPDLSMRGGWGCAGVDRGNPLIDLTPMDEDGGFNGHTWIESGPDRVLDLMHGVEDGPVREYGADRWTIIGAYHRLPRLERQVKLHWKVLMMLCLKIGQKRRAALDTHAESA